jgi:hypothetical protein
MLILIDVIATTNNIAVQYHLYEVYNHFSV